MKTFLKILLLAVFVTSCDDHEPAVFNGDSSNPTFISFSQTAYFLPVERDGVGSVTVTLNASTLSNVDRTYNIQLDEEASLANPENYTLPTSITIPADSYQGTMEITGEDISADVNPLPFVFTLTNVEDVDMDVNSVTVHVGEVCSLSAPFIGSYRVNQLTAPLEVNGGITVFAENSIVNVTMGSSEYERRFTANVYPQAVAGAAVTFRFNLTCGQTFLSEGIDTGIFCTEGNTIKFAVASSPSSFNPEDDSVIEVTFTEEATSSCASPRQTVLQFTKVN